MLSPEGQLLVIKLSKQNSKQVCTNTWQHVGIYLISALSLNYLNFSFYLEFLLFRTFTKSLQLILKVDKAKPCDWCHMISLPLNLKDHMTCNPQIVLAEFQTCPKWLLLANLLWLKCKVFKLSGLKCFQLSQVLGFYHVTHTNKKNAHFLQISNPFVSRPHYHDDEGITFNY